jgi:hypothetical protein
MTFMDRNSVKIIAISLLTMAVSLVFFARFYNKARAFSGFTGAAGSVLAVPVNVVSDIPYSIKEQIEDVIVRSLAKNALTKLQDGVLNKIRIAGINPVTGNEGVPAFVTDWRQFLQAGQYRGEDILRAIIAEGTLGPNSTICKYMRSSLASIFNVKSRVPNFYSVLYRTDSLQPFLLRTLCSPEIMNFDVEAFRRNFKNGGWEAWEKLIQPRNNFYGVFNDSLRELILQRKKEEETNKSEALAGSGFTSRRQNCKGTSSALSCVVLGEVKTPAQILGTVTARSINEDFSWITSADEFSELLASIANALFASLLSKIDNLASGTLGRVGIQVLDVAGCIADCTNAGNRACTLNDAVCSGLSEPQLSNCLQVEQSKFQACKDDVLSSCTLKCSTNVVP